MADFVGEDLFPPFFLGEALASGGTSNGEFLLPRTSTTTYVNRVYDSVFGGFRRWITATPDSTGSSYPGPGVFGVTTSDYCVESILEA